MPTSTTGAMQSAADGAGGHAAMKKQWQTNLEIDLLKNAWIRKDREQYGAHSTPPLSAAKRGGRASSRATRIAAIATCRAL
ncbi:unnamed protein product [Hyaloperonospora brassicae]|uniref:RxLR effector candidate protein n=1 Tax=Hyaloperonospora brassicae TaxID=162125 RepID=A0AAV0TGR6_HYABA|nr:unnamed protein product [Hyaloperonospora brassicae]